MSPVFLLGIIDANGVLKPSPRGGNPGDTNRVTIGRRCTAS